MVHAYTNISISMAYTYEINSILTLFNVYLTTAVSYEAEINKPRGQ